VNKLTGTPVNSVIFMCLAAIALGTPVIGSTVAFNAIASIGERGGAGEFFFFGERWAYWGLMKVQCPCPSHSTAL
jgi:hypothetical protein